MNLVVIDGQGGKLGAQLVKGILSRYPDLSLIAIGTNSTATSAMVKGGAPCAATGENAVLVACRTADIIVGPIGIVIADSLFGEVTPAMAKAVGQANATRILLPVNRCSNLIAGVNSFSVTDLLADVMNKLEPLLNP